MSETVLEDPEEDESGAETAEEPDDGGSNPTPDADDGDYEVAMTDTGEVGDPDGFFDGVDADPEGNSQKSDSEDFFDGTDSGSGTSESSDDGDDGGLFGSEETGPIAPRANETVAKLGVFGLEDGSEKKQLEKDFHELAETVQFGRFSEQSIKKHLNSDFSDIDPVWGMLGAALILAAAIVYKRPDIESENIKASLSGSLGSVNVPFINSE